MLLGSYVIPLVDIFADIKDQISVASIGFPDPSQPLSQTSEVEYSGDEGSSIAGNSSVFSPTWTISTLAAPSSAATSAEASAGRVNFPF